MGTRGAFGFVVNQTEKITYNHFDSYPDGLGLDVLRWLRDTVDRDGEDAAREAAARLQVVNEDASPTEEELASFAAYRDPRVSTGDDWYALLRNTQGNPGEILRAGFFIDGSEFPMDSLFCEYAYIVDFDCRVFQAYEGFRKTPTTEGRWAYRFGIREPNGYYPVQLRARWSFDLLPSEDAFCAEFSDEDDE